MPNPFKPAEYFRQKAKEIQSKVDDVFLAKHSINEVLRRPFNALKQEKDERTPGLQREKKSLLELLNTRVLPIHRIPHSVSSF